MLWSRGSSSSWDESRRPLGGGFVPFGRCRSGAPGARLRRTSQERRPHGQRDRHPPTRRRGSETVSLGASLFLIAVGAILRFAVTATLAGIDIQVSPGKSVGGGSERYRRHNFVSPFLPNEPKQGREKYNAERQDQRSCDRDARNARSSQGLGFPPDAR